MRKITLYGDPVYIGTDREIRSLYARLLRRWNGYKGNYCPKYCNAPMFRKGGMYGLTLEETEDDRWFFVISSDTVLRLIEGGAL